MNYTVALGPGYRIRIKADEQLLNYQASARARRVLSIGVRRGSGATRCDLK
jgi:hypothetical protein